MGVKTTHIITRELAIEIILCRLTEASDEVIPNMLEDLPESEYRNYTIVTDEELEEDKKSEYPIPRIDFIHKF